MTDILSVEEFEKHLRDLAGTALGCGQIDEDDDFVSLLSAYRALSERCAELEKRKDATTVSLKQKLDRAVRLYNSLHQAVLDLDNSVQIMSRADQIRHDNRGIYQEMDDKNYPAQPSFKDEKR